MRRRAAIALLAGTVLLPAAVRLLCYPGYPGSDDAFIHSAVATNLAAGRGWGIQPGEPVNLSSSPLFTLAAAGLTLLGADVWKSGALVTVLAACAGVWLTWWAARRLGLAGLPAALLAATNLHLWRWTGALLETTLAWAVTPLAVGLGAAAVGRGERRFAAWAALGAVLGVAVLLRYELALLAVVVPLQARLDGARPRWGGLGAGLALVTAPWAGYALYRFGTLLPTTLAAKSSAALHWPSTAVLAALGKVALSAAPGALLLLGMGLAWRWRGGAAQADRWAVRRLQLWLPPLAVALFYSVAMDVLQSPGRYFLPFTPLVALLAVSALPAGRPSRLLSGTLTLAVVLQAALALVINERRVAPVLRSMEPGYVAAMRDAAAELRRRCRPGEEVLVITDIGVLAAAGTGECRILDGGGLATPALAGLSLPEMVARHRPRWVLESLGEPRRPLPAAAGVPLDELWSREFPSHGIARPDRRYVVRLFALREAGVGASGVPG